MIGKCVGNIYGVIVRYGIVIEEKMEGGWKFLKIRWYNDDIYEKTMSHRSYLLRQEYSKEFYRVDELLFIDLHKTISSLTEISRTQIGAE